MASDLSVASVPQFHALFNPTLDAIRALGGSASIAEIVNRVIEDLKLTPDITQVPHGKGRLTELEYRLHWSRTYLKKYDLINNSERGVWSLTVSGLDTQVVDPKDIVTFYRAQGRAEPPHPLDDETLTETGEEFIDDSSDEVTSWREALIDALLAMSSDAFERLCQRVLRESGFIEVQVTGKSGDGGIDGHGIIRLAGLISFPVMFQCKRYANNVSSSVVRDFRGAMEGRADKGLILTTGRFTRDAHQEATREGARPIDLIDGELLMDKLKDLRLGVRVSTRTVEDVEVNPAWFDSV